jgi:hypothetical protein
MDRLYAPFVTRIRHFRAKSLVSSRFLGSFALTRRALRL